MENRAVAAVMVTFHPDTDVYANIRHLAQQFDRIVIVDNGSPAEHLAGLRATQADAAFELIALPINRGLGAGLNEGIRAVKQMDCPFVCLFDQDGQVTDGFLQSMLCCFEAQPRSVAGSIGCGTLVPAYLDRNTGTPIPPVYTPAGYAGNRIEAAMTSGSLLPMEIFDEIGLFDERFFIDGTDYELSLRLRRRGYYITQCREAVLKHAPGRRKDIVWRGRTICTVSNYSPARRYYSMRNTVYLVICNIFAFWPLSRFLVSHYLKEAVKVVLFEPHKLKSLSAMVHGIWDGLRGRLGHTVKL